MWNCVEKNQRDWKRKTQIEWIKNPSIRKERKIDLNAKIKEWDSGAWEFPHKKIQEVDLKNQHFGQARCKYNERQHNCPAS